MSDVTQLSAAAMAAMIRAGEISATELVDAHFRRIHRLNDRLNAFVAIDEERARRHAALADQAIANHAPLGRLHGVPITIKSSIDVEGLPCEAGTRLRQGYVAKADAPLVSRLKAAGAIVLGNTTVPEFLMAWETDSALYGRTNSPWHWSRTPGGSSGGEAAAIAACCSAGGIGSDGGGSIRVPAHFSGICGLKPTPGRVPATGHFPASVGPFALLGVVGPMARTIEDLSLFFDVIAGPDNGDPNAAPVPVQNIDHATLMGTRIGVFADEDGRIPVTAETHTALRETVRVLRQQGFTVDLFHPEGLDEALRLWHALFIDGVGMILRQAYQGRETDMHSIVREILRMADHDPPLTADSLLEVLFARDRVRAKFLEQMDHYPILLCPVSSIPAFRHGEREWPVGETTVRYPDVFSYCQYFNLLGNPAAVVPISTSLDGLPIGLQIVGRPWEEERVLAIARCVEQAGGWKEPPAL